MSCRAWVLIFASLSIAVAVYAAEKPGDKPSEKPGGPPPLVVDKGAPLLLAEPPEEDPDEVPEGPLADNSWCFVCHTNYEEEPLAVVHAKANVGCVKCHGQSYKHRDDEDNVTPPDIMYWPEKIKSNCEKCHDEHDAPAVKVIARWQQHCPAITDPEKIVCTDCHGQHRLKVRTVWWDKKTRKLVIRKEGQTTKVRPDLKKKPMEEPKKAPNEGLGPAAEMQ